MKGPIYSVLQLTRQTIVCHTCLAIVLGGGSTKNPIMNSRNIVKRKIRHKSSFSGKGPDIKEAINE